MDSDLLALFSPEEILRRLTQKGSTGGLHVFTAKESANIFLKDGAIVGAAKGLVEGEEVVRQVLDWKDARLVWQSDQPVTGHLKPLEIDFSHFLLQFRAAPKLEIAGRVLSEAGKTGDLPRPASFVSSSQPLPKRSSATGPIPAKSDAFKTAPIPPEEPKLTATKSIGAIPAVRSAFEESLLRKFKFALVSVEDDLPCRLGITRPSILVGRNPACDFTLEHSSVSRQHCILQLTERGLLVRDLGTTNGTRVNGIALKEGYINVGDQLTIGHVKFLVEKQTEEAIAA